MMNSKWYSVNTLSSVHYTNVHSSKHSPSDKIEGGGKTGLTSNRKRAESPAGGKWALTSLSANSAGWDKDEESMLMVGHMKCCLRRDGVWFLTGCKAKLKEDALEKILTSAFVFPKEHRSSTKTLHPFHSCAIWSSRCNDSPSAFSSCSVILLQVFFGLPLHWRTWEWDHLAKIGS